MTIVVSARPVLAEPIEQPADILVDRGDGAQIAFDVALVFERSEFALGLETELLAGELIDQDKIANIIRVRDLAIGRALARHRLTNFAAAFRLHEAEIAIGHVGSDAHLRRLPPPRARFL